MALLRVHVIVEGVVQGVFFRAYTAEEAKRLTLTGWVRNRSDGSVEAEIEGEKKDVEKMLIWFHKGSPLSQVQKVVSAPRENRLNEREFMIRYS